MKTCQQEKEPGSVIEALQEMLAFFGRCLLGAFQTLSLILTDVKENPGFV